MTEARSSKIIMEDTIGTVGKIRQLSEHERKMTELNIKMLFRRIERLEERVRELEENALWNDG